MKKRILSVFLCFCMTLSLLPMSALAAEKYNSWDEATADGVTLNEGDTVTVDGTDYIYKVNADTIGIEMYTKNAYGNKVALTEASCWKAGNGYVLYKPTVETFTADNPYQGARIGTFATSAEVTMHNATISTADACTLALPYNSGGPDMYPVPVTVKVEGANSLTTTNKMDYSLYHQAGDTTFTGGGTLSLTNSAATAWYNFQNIDAVTIESGTHVTVSGNGNSHIVGNLTVTGSGSKLTIASGTKLTMGIVSYNIDPDNAPTVTVENGAVLENNGTLDMQMRTKDTPGITGEISGGGGILFGSTKSTTQYRLINGKLYTYGGDISTSGLNLTSNAPTTATCYKVGNGYVLWKPKDGETPATVTLHSADINVSNGYALVLPSDSDTAIVVEGNNSLKSSDWAVSNNNGNITIQGGGTLSAQSSNDGIPDIFCHKVLTITGGASVSAPTIYSTGSIIVDTTGNITAPQLVALDTFTYKKGNITGSWVSECNGDEHNDEMPSVYGNVTLTKDYAVSAKTGENCLTVTAGATLTINGGVTLTINDGASIVNNGNIVNNGIINLPKGTTAEQIAALHISGNRIIKVDGKDVVVLNGKLYNYGGKLTDSLIITAPPNEATYYELQSGSHDCYIIFTPKSGDENAVLVLHDVNNSGYLMGGVILPHEPVTLKLEGKNYISHISASNDITISGDGMLYSKINNSNADAVLTIGSGAALNALYQTETNSVTTFTIYGSYFGAPMIDANERYVLAPKAVLMLEKPNVLIFAKDTPLENLVFGTGSSIVNNNMIAFPQGTTAEKIAALPLSGTGVVMVPTKYDSKGEPETWDIYDNNGTSLKVIIGGLDLTQDGHSVKTIENDGYTFNNNTLTLGNTCIAGNITLPENAIVNTAGIGIIGGNITPQDNSQCNLTFSGSGNLTVNGDIANAQGGTMTVSGGADVTVNGTVNIGTSGGADGTLNVTGAGTTLNVSSNLGHAVLFNAVNLSNGASLTAKAEGSGTIGVEALSGVSITGGSTLTTGCDYGVYIMGGKFTVDNTSKLVTNGAVASFCIVDTTSNKSQSEVLALSGIPNGTEIKSVAGTKGKYWSLVPTGGNLTVDSATENNTPVTLMGAKIGELTFVKAASSGDSSGGSVSTVSYKLSFETNGGSKISDVSKENGTTIDLTSYKPTRDGYDFGGWYSDKALTDKINSVKLAKNSTVYAKWTEKSAKISNPFTDVSESSYYYDAVLWAVQKNVTSGTTNTAFSPNMICTRAQMVTFLWRAMGSPEPTSTNSPFTDVSKDDYYYKAVLWAVEKDVTAGVSSTIFSPDSAVTRGQSVTFMWRAEGKPSASSANPFTDVSKDAYYYNAMLWAVERGITQGTSSATFSPSSFCNRSQIVAFLYRYAGK